MSVRHGPSTTRAILELALAPVIALGAFRLCALVMSWLGFESVSAAFVSMLWSAPAFTTITYGAVLLLGVPTVLALHRPVPVQRWAVGLAWAILPFAVVFGFTRLLPAPSLIVAGVAGAVLTGQAAARTRLESQGPPRSHDGAH